MAGCAVKACLRCEAEKPLDAFTPHKHCKMGVHSKCKACLAEERRLQRVPKPKAPRFTHEQRRITARRAEQRYAAKDPAAYRQARAERARRSRQTTEGRLRNRLGPSLRRCLARGKGGQSTAALLGYSIADLRTHLERQFLLGMGWHNMDKWHIDHIVPLSSFTITGPDDPELRRAWALSNLQPLWALDNIKKSNRIPA